MAKQFGTAIVVLLIASFLYVGSGSRVTAATASQSGKIAQLLEQSGYSYTKAADNVWTITFKGKSLSEFKLFITSAEGIIVIGTVVAKKENIKATPEMMRTLLKLTDRLDRVKIGFDGDDDLFARVEVSARVFDGAELKANVEQLAAATDEIYAAIKQYLLAK